MKKQGSLMISISLLFAALMLLAAWVAPDDRTKSLWVHLLIAAWWIPFSVLSLKGDKCCKVS